MAQSITKSLDELNLNDQPDPEKRPAEDPYAPAEYKPLPTGWRDIGRYLFYGWPVNDAMCEEYFKRYPEARRFSPDLLCAVLWHIESRVGYFDGRVAFAKVDDRSPADRIVHWDSGDHFYILALSCTKNKYLYYRRPNRRQMKALVDAFGEEPRWLTDYHDKETFDQLAFE